MRVHVLGYWGTYPSAGEATTGFLLEAGEARVVIDLGSGVLAQLFKVCAIEQLTAAIVTHHHHDHTADLGVFCYSVLLSRLTGTRQQKLPLYLPEGPGQIMQELRREPLLEVNVVTEQSTLQIGNFKVSFARTRHPVYCLAVRVEHHGRTFVFSADSSQCSELVHIAQEADLFICETSMYKGQEDQAIQAGHLTAEQAGQIAKQAGVKQLAITHYPHYGDLGRLVAEAESAFGKPVVKLRTLQVLEV